MACGTKDGLLFFLDKKNLSKVLKMNNMKALLEDLDGDSSYNPAIRSIDILGNKLILGTLGS